VTQQFTAARDAGQPQVFCDSGWQVAENPFYGIRAYDGLSICFFYNAQVRDWESALQPDVFCLLKGVKDGPCRDMTNDTRRDLLLRGNPDNFPWFATFFQNKPHFIKLTVPQVHFGRSSSGSVLRKIPWMPSSNAWPASSTGMERAHRTMRHFGIRARNSVSVPKFTSGVRSRSKTSGRQRSPSVRSSCTVE
jgi:hypothetical protein